MLFFRKNRREFGYRSHRRVFVAMFLLLLCSTIFPLVLSVMAEQEPIRSVEFTSELSNYENQDKGAWKVTKSARWEDTGKAEITIDVNSIKRFRVGHKKDIVLVVDDSGWFNQSMGTIRSACSYFVNELLDDEENQIALVSYHSDSYLLSGFTNNKSSLLGLIDGLIARDEKNLYRGLQQVDELLEGYTPSDDRELITIIVASGYPNMNTPNEESEYLLLKNKYPYMTINAIQYGYGDLVAEPLVAASDFQYMASSTSLRNTLLQAADTPYVYDNFVITDFIDSQYWTIDGLRSIEATRGTVSLDQSEEDPKVVWDLSGKHFSGQKDSMTIKINLRSEYYDAFGTLLIPTNTGTSIATSMIEIQNENVSKTDTPIIKDHYSVSYEANLPSGCTTNAAVPELATYTIFTTVAIADNQLSCDGWVFKGWKSTTKAASLLNDNYFRMPEEDVIMKAAWSKLSISKSMDGTPHIRGNALFLKGDEFNGKMFALTGHDRDDWDEYESWDNGDFFGNQEIKKIARAATIPGWVDTREEQYLLSDESSQLPIYGWYNDDTFYYYSDADVIYMNEEADEMFSGLDQLTDISGLSQINTSRVTSMQNLFEYDHSLNDLSPIAGWDVSNVYNMNYMFMWCYGLTTLESLADWEVSSLYDMASMFEETRNIESLHGLENWRPEYLYSMDYAFSIENLSDISALSGWRLPDLNSMWRTFAYTQITNLDALADWGGDEPGGLNMGSMSGAFSGCEYLTDISGLEKWQPENLIGIDYMFYSTGIDSIDILADWGVAPARSLDGFISYTDVSDISIMANWDLTKVTTMNYAFSGTNVSDISVLNLPIKIEHMAYAFSSTNISDISPLASWNTTNLRSFFGAFNRTKISDLTPLQNWDVSRAATYSNLFAYTNITNVDALSQWHTDSATSFYGIVQGTNITSISGMRNWNTSKITDLNYAFQGTKELTDFSPISEWDLPVISSLKGTFQNSGITDLTQISGWNISNITTMEDLFSGANNVTTLNGLGGWDVTKTRSLYKTFKNMSNLLDISALSSWTTSALNDITETFSGDSRITDLSPLNNWDASKITRKALTFTSIPSSVTRPTWY